MKRTIKIFIIILIFIVVTLISYFTYIMLIRNMAEVAHSGNWDKVERMINNDEDINARIRSNYALVNAIKIIDFSELNAYENAEHFYDHLFMNAQALTEISVLMIACIEEEKEIVELLIEKGADVNEKSSFHGTALTCAVRSGNIEITKLLIDNGADISIDSNYGFYGATPLIHATITGDYEMVKFLIDNGADVDLSAPIIFAVMYDQFDIANLLYANITDSKYSNEEKLLICSYVGDLDEVKELVLDKKTDPNVNGSRSPLSVAIESENLEIIDFLIDEGADPNAKFYFSDMDEKMSAKDYAKEKGIELD